ncbi:unnamed protein product [Onchocerca ochengi]|uniref:Uncharacterized protein n=1 Tax=Onchocerca ochengi TaxID=42157 RepID=A0A182EYV0_ONCOC|nr:unnamed protein product [Onchocerca ochengi]
MNCVDTISVPNNVIWNHEFHFQLSRSLCSERSRSEAAGRNRPARSRASSSLAAHHSARISTIPHLYPSFADARSSLVGFTTNRCLRFAARIRWSKLDLLRGIIWTN